LEEECNSERDEYYFGAYYFGRGAAGEGLAASEEELTGGIGGEIAAIIAEEAFEWLDAPVVRVASIDTPVPYSPPLEDYYLPQTKDVLNAARKLAAY